MKDLLSILKAFQGKKSHLKSFQVNFKKTLMILLMLIGQKELKFHLSLKHSMISWISIRNLI